MNNKPEKAPKSEESDDTHPLRRVSLRTFESLIDQQVREAEQAGQFRDLPGAGRPLDFSDDANVPDEMKVGFRMLKNAGYAPPWIELQKSIREDQAALASWLERTNKRWPRLSAGEQEQLRAEYAEKLRELNKQISNYNLSVPPVAGQLPLLQPWRELRKLGSS